jgi:hypothetical protein
MEILFTNEEMATGILPPTVSTRKQLDAERVDLLKSKLYYGNKFN